MKNSERVKILVEAVHMTAGVLSGDERLETLTGKLILHLNGVLAQVTPKAEMTAEQKAMAKVEKELARANGRFLRYLKGVGMVGGARVICKATGEAATFAADAEMTALGLRVTLRKADGSTAVVDPMAYRPDYAANDAAKAKQPPKPKTITSKTQQKAN